MTKVAILWHMHQPFYEDLVTHEHILPWVRMHALKDYYGMIALLREFPDVHMTFNLVPSLMVQLEEFAAGRAHDRHLELSLKPAAELTPADAVFILENFFHAQRARMIDVYPRYAELAARRGGGEPDAAQARTLVPRYSVGDLRDLQVWQKLAWIDPIYLDGDARVRALVEKGRDFSEEDKALLHEVELELLNKVIPEYREAAERGQAELSTSPFYHPILPLLCDTDVYLRTHPDARRPRQRFAHPEDAALQLARAVQCHERLFGHPPAGLWPSEGSVSDAMVPLVAGAGFRWMATDELILARTLHTTFTRDGHGRVEQPESLYRPYRVDGRRRAHRVRVPRSCALRPHRLRVRQLARRRGGRRLRGTPGRGRPPLPRPDPRRRGDHPDHSRRRERLGALRGGRPPVPARALRPPVLEPGAPDRHHGRGLRGRATELHRHLPRLLDRRQLLYLDRPR